MSCVNCPDGGDSYTLTAHVTEQNADLELSFCSTDCLAEWV